MKTLYTIIYTDAAHGTTGYERKTERGAYQLAGRLMGKDNARGVQIERTQFDASGTRTEIIHTRGIS